MKVFTPEAVRQTERFLIQYENCTDLGLMRKAVEEIYSIIEGELSGAQEVCILCGKGNNSGDGYGLARLIQRDGIHVSCVRVFEDAPCTESARVYHDYFCEEGGTVTDDLEKSLKRIVNSDVVIDAVFGIGFNGFIEKGSRLYNIIDIANNAPVKRIALDIPSGVNALDGSIGNIAFKADVTITVGVVKSGMLSYPAKKYCNRIRVAEIGLTEGLLNRHENEHFLVPDDGYCKKALPAREADSNKGDFGKLLMICGSENMTGAAVLSVGAALRAGAGLVTLASQKCVSDVVKLKYPEAIYTDLDFDDGSSVNKLLDDINRYSAVLIGCGLGQSKSKKELVFRIIREYKGRLIIDADGINMISDNINVLKEAACEVIITPHPGEFSRISGISIPEINANRIKCARDFSHAYGCITVLKGAGTVTALYGEITAINNTGNPGLAKGGSGDVLAGLIASLAASKYIKPVDAAICGVYLHGRAADILKEKYSEYGLLPHDLAKEIARLLP